MNFSEEREPNENTNQINKKTVGRNTISSPSLEKAQACTRKKIQKVLVVDDDPQVGRYLTRALGRKDIEVTALNSPVEALELLRREKFDLIITDLKMPSMNGNQLIETAKAADVDPPVILITGTPDEVGETKADIVLKKPFELNEFYKAVEEIEEKINW